MLSFISREDIENMCLLETIRLEGMLATNVGLTIEFESASKKTQFKELEELLSQSTSVPVAAHLIRYIVRELSSDSQDEAVHLRRRLFQCRGSSSRIL